jgi:hypothetical protein
MEIKSATGADFVESDELREAKARSKARRLGYKIENDQSGYRLLRITGDDLIADNLTLDTLGEWLDRFEDEDPTALMKSIIAENPGASEKQIQSLWLDEVLADKKLLETVLMQIATKAVRETRR